MVVYVGTLSNQALKHMFTFDKTLQFSYWDTLTSYDHGSHTEGANITEH